MNIFNHALREELTSLHVHWEQVRHELIWVIGATELKQDTGAGAQNQAGNKTSFILKVSYSQELNRYKNINWSITFLG